MGQPSFRRTLLVFVGLQLGQVMSSIDGTIVATALPTIAGDIGGFSRSTWVVTAYALAMVASMPIYGKLGDLYGRRRVLLSAIAIFLIGSMACGSAQTMDQLLVARFVQGLGSGGLGALAMATVADIVPARQLGRWLGYQGVIYAVASAIGPIVGGLFVDHLSWRWAFLINLPIGLLAAAIVATKLQLAYRRIPHAIDWSGSVLLTGGLSLFVVLATLGGHEIPWGSARALGAGAGLALISVLFVRRERRAPEPVLPLALFRNPVLRVATGINFTSGLLLWCGIFFVPQFVQQVREVSPTRSGLVLMPLMFGAALGTLVTGRLVARTGRYRTWPIAGSVLMTVAMVLLAGLGEGSPVLAAALSALLLGTGAGFVMQPSLLAAQNGADSSQLGTATSTTLLFRTLGNTVGIPVFGGILNAGLSGTGLSPADVAGALRPVFAVAVLVGLASTVVALRLPERPLRERTAFEEESDERSTVAGPEGTLLAEAAEGPMSLLAPPSGRSHRLDQM
jgi:EmrB/QacA subfamily drug resistance transporter